MTNEQQEQYREKGLTVFEVGPEIHLLRGNEKYVFKDLAELESHVVEVRRGISDRVFWEISDKAMWEPYKKKENGS